MTADSQYRFRADFTAADAYRTVRTLETLSEAYGIPRDQWVKLNQNENSYGPASDAAEAVSRIELHRYPDTSSASLRGHLGDFLNVSPDQIVCGNGGDEVIDVLFRLFMDPGDEAINLPPTFGFYPVAAKLNRAKLVPVPRDRNFQVDVDAIAAAVTPRTKLILLCNPNNPTANLTSESDVARVLDIGIPVVLDEAYVEFAGTTCLPLQARYPHLMVIRTFSKWAGLAGLRIGYGIFSPELAGHVRTIRPAYTVNAAAEAAAVASLQNRHRLHEIVADIRSARDRLIEMLADSSILHAWPSATNFIYCTAGEKCSVGFVYEELLKRGVIVRLFGDPDAIRITVGRPHENQRLLDGLVDIENNVSRETIAASANGAGS